MNTDGIKNGLAEIFNRMPVVRLLRGEDESDWSKNGLMRALKGMPVFQNDAGQSAYDAAMNIGPMGIGKIVYHGSPHKFDKFDASKIGTGEGAQAYGHGVYLADAEEVAKGYRRELSNNIRVDAKGVWAKSKADGKEYGPFESIKDAFAGVPQDSGALYKADLPDEWIPKMLDWDKPLSQQSPEVQKAIDAHIGKVVSFDPINDTTFRMNFSGAPIGGYWGDKNKAIQEAKKYITGKQFYEAAGKLDNISYPDSAAFLKDQGIPGIRYLDGGSRGKGQGSYNYVVFPGLEDKVKILERNGQPVNALAEILK